MLLSPRTTNGASDPNPVERFRGSHQPILDGLSEFRRLPMLFEAMQQARSTAEATLALFQRQIIPHHLEEEQELFVAVRNAACGEERERVDELVARLVAQHRRLDQLWLRLRPTLEAIAGGTTQDFPDFRNDVLNLVDAYLDHTRLEERVFLPLADQILSRCQDGSCALDPSEHLRKGRPARG